MLAAGYFAFLLTATICFKNLPTKTWRWGGFVWATGLAISFTYLSSQICWVCLVAHACHILLWIVWKPQHLQEEILGIKLALAFTSSFAMMALFSTLNFTFMVYGLQMKSPVSSLVQEGSVIKSFTIDAIDSKELAEHQGVIFHFVSPSCPYCKEQIPQLDRIAKEYADNGYRFINISPRLTPELQELSHHLEWVEDNSLSSIFGIEGFPTLVVVDRLGVVLQTMAGASSDFESKLRSKLGGSVN